MIEKNTNIIINPYEIKITEHSKNTKLEFICSINTSVLFNLRCQRNSQIKGSVCEKCYAKTYLKMRPALGDNCDSNTQLLTSVIISKEYLPSINSQIFRFESFGDLNNETQFINYLNICNKNKKTTFAIWTKNPDIMDTVFNEMKYKKPKNLIIVVSSLFLNVEFKLKNMPYEKRYWFIDKIFTVYTADYAIKNNVPINCDRKKCNNCRLCYSKNNTFIVNEILKSQSKKYNKMLSELKGA